MKSLSSVRSRLPLVAQCGLILVGLVALYAAPPASGTMLLVPLTRAARAELVPMAVANGARLVAAGPWAGSFLVDGQRDRLARPLLGKGVIALSARAGGCGAAAG
ncbi:hypothetical protein K3M67_01705 [Sphingobium sp. V4]|uniref:hypothetical protein n=1 Tax=Sphingobium sp. V4 TaxID=3038927 RepID=UPI0025581357|nr:hypothetical protein [Sphingobium sp. V4]WIW88725.1 hypothetical protein K3M67_01705 [Sphingobium sp. V4]